MKAGFDGSNVIIAKRQLGESVIGDHYVFNKQHSQFIYQALERTKTLALPAKAAYELLSKYPEFDTSIRATVYNYYKKWIYKPV